MIESILKKKCIKVTINETGMKPKKISKNRFLPSFDDNKLPYPFNDKKITKMLTRKRSSSKRIIW